MKKMFLSILTISLLMFYYSFYMNIKSTQVLFEGQNIENIISGRDLCIDSETLGDLHYALKDVKNTTKAIAIDIKVLWFLLLLNVIVSVVGIIKSRKYQLKDI